MNSDKNKNSNQFSQIKKQQTILFVDPDQNAHELINMILHGSDECVVVSSYSAKEAIEKAGSLSGNIDLLLLELIPQDLYSYKIYKELQQDDFLRHVPVIFQTGMLYIPEEIKELRRTGKADIIYKPYSKIELFAATTRLVSLDA